MKIKKILCIAMSIITAGALFAGCGKSEGNSSGSKSGKVTLVYGLWDKNQEPVMQDIAKKFTEKNPNIEVKVQITPYKQYWTKLETEAQGENLPDVFWMNGPNIIKYADASLLLPIDDKIKESDIKVDNYPKALVDLYNVGGKQYGIPKDWDTTAVWYNKEIFDNAKVPYPKSDWTWNDMRETAKKLTDKSKGIYGIAAAQDDQQGYYNTIPQAGGFIISEDKKKSGFDQPGAVEGIQCWIDLIKDGSSPTGEQMLENTPQDLFASGKVAMVFQGSWMVPQFMKNDAIKDKIDIAPMPKIKKNSAVIHGLSNVIYSKSKNPKEAWEFVKYLSGSEANEIIAKSGVVIPAYKPSLEIFLKSYANINLKAYTDAVEYSVMYPVSKNTSKWTTIQDENLKKVWANQMTAEEATKKIGEEMNKLLQEEK
ncbi:carbohydrate ABC transporter substrate-binding protein, CUT1 family [Clostridium amylolyticum]|uniref:Carbohydrate ABC transporter substrate-binding protein, CUT1 family n=1 Tax=Clostridium amylolyticum TaxID=1121298 RepID=A0A1M6GUU8_9CLOT|nr:sugar ABC transporter substrate-binding protein [Clostridium amylolyticum]SHJ13684.1 carbohydrate ABC transporter substrate-binding protein, CUT1 family [Clostridium amylolyticum]